MEAGLFEAKPAPGEAAGEDVEGDVGGVLLMMAEGGDGIFGGGLTVRVGDGADGGVADWRGVEAEESALAEMDVVERGDLHEEVVGVLAVDDGFAEGGFALLKELGVLAGADRGGFERKHGAESELAVSAVGAELTHGHGHDPVGGEEFVGAARAALLGVGDEGAAVEHEHPSAVVVHEHGDGC